MEYCFEITKQFREIEFGSKIDKAISIRMKGLEIALELAASRAC